MNIIGNRTAGTCEGLPWSEWTISDSQRSILGLIEGDHHCVRPARRRNPGVWEAVGYSVTLTGRHEGREVISQEEFTVEEHGSLPRALKAAKDMAKAWTPKDGGATL